ncbi:MULTISPECIES: hypothetical protein [Streptomyces]|uniref:Secreted protein n=2 Tax=Streptomyces TaxID=1883 RepID=A0ABV9IRN5_9ACTN
MAGGVRRRLAAVMAVLTACGILAIAAPATAQAASAPCPGRKVRTVSFPTGSVQVYKSGDWICAVTVQTHPGTRRHMSVSVQARGHRPVLRARKSTRSSPAVRVYAGHRSVLVKGSVGSRSGSSGWFRC